jgi:hypothetical protein
MAPPTSSPRGVTFVAAATFVLIWASSASAGQPSAAELHATARSLIQPAMRVTRIKDGGCGEGFAFPSCVGVYFQITGRLTHREAAALTPAQAKGWRIIKHFHTSVQDAFKLERGPYTVTYGFWLDRWYRPTKRCAAGDPTLNRLPACADSFELLGYHDTHP